MDKRDFLKAGMGLAVGGLALRAAAAHAQAAATPAPAQIPTRNARTHVMFKAPPGLPNALETTPEGLWIGEQKMSGSLAIQYKVPEPTDLREAAWLVDANGKVLRTVMTQARNTSGMAVGGGYVWMGGSLGPSHNGFFQTDFNNNLIAQRQVPLGPPGNGGGIHGAFWKDGKLWVLSNRLLCLIRIEPTTWTPELVLPVNRQVARFHDICWDNGSIWAITGNNADGFANGRSGLHRYDASTGALLEIVNLVPGSADPHGLTMLNGRLISCDAGIHPGWPNFDSPYHGTVFEIEFT